MNATLANASIVFVISCGAFAQEFEVASVKLNKSGSTESSDAALPGGELAGRNIPMMTLLTFAYDVRENYIVGGPSWIKSDRFDVVAKAPPNTPKAAMPAMLQSLLAQSSS